MKRVTEPQKWTALAKLVEAGHMPEESLHKPGVCPKQLADGVRSYQRSVGVKATGRLNVQTFRLLTGLYFCNVPEPSGGYDSCLWPHKDISWSVLSALPSISQSQLVDHVQAAFAAWAAVCGIRPTYKANSKTANLYVTVANLGGPMGTLADCELPCGARENSVLRLRLDTSEGWETSIDLDRVLVHELGHGLGLGHGQDIMLPSYSNHIEPGAWSIAEVVKRYGATVPQEPTPPPSGKRKVKCRLLSMESDIELEVVR